MTQVQTKTETETRRLALNIPADVYDGLAELAHRDLRTVPNQVLTLLKNVVSFQPKPARRRVPRDPASIIRVNALIPTWTREPLRALAAAEHQSMSDYALALILAAFQRFERGQLDPEIEERWGAITWESPHPLTIRMSPSSHGKLSELAAANGRGRRLEASFQIMEACRAQILHDKHLVEEAKAEIRN